MSFRPGHEKQGGRKSGTPNKLTGEAREVARRLLADAAYQESLQERLIRGEAPRLEVHLWELAYGKPRAEPETAPEGAGAVASLAQVLEKLGQPRTENYRSDTCVSPDTDQRDTEEEPT